MSREIKVCNVNTLNDVNDRVRSLQRSVAADLERVKLEAEQRAVAQAARRIEEVRANMANRLDREIRGVNERVVKMDAEHRRRLQELSGRMSEDMRSMGRQLNGRIDELQRNMERRFRSQEADITILQKNVSGLFNMISDEMQKRREAVKTVTAYREEAFRRSPIRRFLPDKAAEIDMRISRLDPDSSACLSMAEEVCIQLLLAEEKAIKEYMIFSALQEQALSQAKEVLEVVKSNRRVDALHPEDAGLSEEEKKDRTVSLETDFWVRGAYSSVEKELEDLKRELNLMGNEAEKPDADRIDTIMARISELQQKADEMIETAVARAVLSENRVIVTEDIVTALIRQGYEVKLDENGNEAIQYLGGEEDNDWREGVFAILRKAGGEEITIVVRPDAGEVNNQIIFHRNDERNLNDTEYISSIRRIKQEIEKSGHSLGQITAPSDGGHEQIPELRDARRLSRKGAAGKVNERVRTR